jgi:hypothetical protein
MMPSSRQILLSLVAITALTSSLKLQAGEAPLDRGDWQRFSKSTIPQNKSVKLLVSIGWEGRDLKSVNLKALREFRRTFRDVKILHFISPAYFERETPTVNAAVIREMLLAGDKLGVLVGGWKSVVTSAGVPFRKGPTMWGHDLRGIDCKADCGEEIPLYAYSDEEIDKIVVHSVNTLQHQGFGNPGGILASGWLASPAVLSAASRSGIRYDFSVVPPQLLAPTLSPYPLFGWIKNLWSTVTPLSQAFETKTASGTMIQIPQNFAAMDYLVAGQALQIFKDMNQEMTSHPDNSFTVHLMIYQETAAQTIPLLTRSLQEIFAFASEHGISVQSLDLPFAPIVPAAAQALVHEDRPSENNQTASSEVPAAPPAIQSEAAPLPPAPPAAGGVLKRDFGVH